MEGRSTTTALAATGGTRLGMALAADAAAHPGKTGVFPLGNPRDAFAARAVLAAAAERSLDLQYYIWHDDPVGYLLFDGVWQAAERGVRVRLLLDDNNTGASTQRSRRSMPTRTSRCGSTTPSCSGRRERWAT